MLHGYFAFTGNVKRSDDVDDRHQPLLDRLRVAQKSLATSGQYLDTSGPDYSGTTRLKLWIAHRLLTGIGYTKGRNDVADLTMMPLPRQKQAIRSKNTAAKIMSEAQERLVRLFRMRGDAGDSQVMPEHRVTPPKHTGEQSIYI